MEKLKEKIEKKQNEVRELNTQLKLKKNKQYEHLIGNYYQLAATCCFRVDEIEYVDSTHIHVLGLNIYGGEKYSNSMSVETSGFGSISTESDPTQISKEDFLDFFDKSVVH